MAVERMGGSEIVSDRSDNTGINIEMRARGTKRKEGLKLYQDRLGHESVIVKKSSFRVVVIAGGRGE